MERRRSERITKRLEVKYWTNEENTAITNDLSETGLFIRTNRGMKPGSSIDLKLNLPNSQELFLSGRVVRSMKSLPGLVGDSKSGMGIELIEPPPEYIDYVRSLRS
jgi:Tfp pilus assembly protein PilZ